MQFCRVEPDKLVYPLSFQAAQTAGDPTIKLLANAKEKTPYQSIALRLLVSRESICQCGSLTSARFGMTKGPRHPRRIIYYLK